MRPEAAYHELIRRTREESLLACCAELLGWDEETYLPRGGVAHRAEQMALLAGMQHARATDPRLGELLDILEGSPLINDPSLPVAANVRELRRLYRRHTRLPRQLVEELARVTSLAHQEWVAARTRNDFARFKPWLTKIVGLKRREAESLCDGGPLYDALLEEYEPGALSDELARLFEALRTELVPLVAAVRDSRQRTEADVLRRHFPIETQQQFCAKTAAAVGFDFARGRLDTTDHPFFTAIGPDDCRLTTRYDAHDFGAGFFGMMHEVGHGLYEQGLDAEHFGTPLGCAASLGLHESQARLWENTIGRSWAFWRNVFPQAQKAFPQTLGDVALDDWHHAVNRVELAADRVHADELTYNLHILVRFELEQALLNGDLETADLGASWQASYQRYLGVTPKNDTEGCLQDGHWASGLFGYFPTYTLGNVYGAQLFATASRELDGVDEFLADGQFRPLLEWLCDRVYRQGHRYPAAHLIERVTGAPPSHHALVRALRAKYSELYGV
jgi:carboxypeptidase Taq